MMPTPMLTKLYPSDIANPIGAMNANDEPRKTGTMPLVTRWNMSVQIPAESKARLGLNPRIRGTRTVAPNIATVCCNPRTTRRCAVISSIPSPLLHDKGRHEGGLFHMSAYEDGHCVWKLVAHERAIQMGEGPFSRSEVPRGAGRVKHRPTPKKTTALPRVESTRGVRLT